MLDNAYCSSILWLWHLPPPGFGVDAVERTTGSSLHPTCSTKRLRALSHGGGVAATGAWKTRSAPSRTSSSSMFSPTCAHAKLCTHACWHGAGETSGSGCPASTCLSRNSQKTTMNTKMETTLSSRSL
ncbi:hypothetical protein ZWY2020_003044 [Hordeum vulgare]|nr:hypothetical protein ZWY2020_003044 [Hordeum vulgare]